MKVTKQEMHSAISQVIRDAAASQPVATSSFSIPPPPVEPIRSQYFLRPRRPKAKQLPLRLSRVLPPPPISVASYSFSQESDTEPDDPSDKNFIPSQTAPSCSSSRSSSSIANTNRKRKRVPCPSPPKLQVALQITPELMTPPPLPINLIEVASIQAHQSELIEERDSLREELTLVTREKEFHLQRISVLQDAIRDVTNERDQLKSELFMRQRESQTTSQELNQQLASANEERNLKTAELNAALQKVQAQKKKLEWYVKNAFSRVPDSQLEHERKVTVALREQLQEEVSRRRVAERKVDDLKNEVAYLNRTRDRKSSPVRWSNRDSYERQDHQRYKRRSSNFISSTSHSTRSRSDNYHRPSERRARDDRDKSRKTTVRCCVDSCRLEFSSQIQWKNHLLQVHKSSLDL